SFNQIGTGYTDYWAGAPGGWYGFIGQIDEVRIWNAVRTADEIQLDSAAPLTGTESGLAAYYRFDEGSGTTARDATPNHRDGTLGTSGSNLPAWATATGQAIDLGASSIFPDGHEALHFDGSGSHVQLPSFSLGGALTLEAWVKSDNIRAGW